MLNQNKNNLKRKVSVTMKDFDLFTVDEVTDILKVSRRTLYNYIKSGDLKAAKIGKYWRIRKEDLKEFIDKGIYR